MVVGTSFHFLLFLHRLVVCVIVIQYKRSFLHMTKMEGGDVGNKFESEQHYIHGQHNSSGSECT